LRILVLAAAFSLTMAHPAAADDPLKAGLVGWWRFDEASGTTATDSSGSGNTGTLVGGITRVAGKVGSALSFTNGSMVKGSNAGTDFPISGAPRTLAAWVKTPAGAPDSVVFGFGTATGPDESRFYLQIVGGSVSAAIGGTGWAISGTTRVDDGAWHHLAGIYEGSGTNMVRVYVDGQLDEYSTVAQVPNTGTGSNWQIGQALGGTWPFAGSIDEVRLYNRALSAPEIQSIVIGDGGTIGPVPIGMAQAMNIKPCAPEPGITELAYGDVADCAIGSVGDTDTFHFTGRAGDTIWLMVARTAGNADQCLRVTDPDGVDGGVRCTSYQPRNLYYTSSLTKTGTYSVEVRDSNYASTFNYQIGLKRLIPLPANLASLPYFSPKSGALHTGWDWHYYAIHGTAGDRVTLSLVRTNGAADHCASLYKPSGAIMYNACTSYQPSTGACQAL